MSLRVECFITVRVKKKSFEHKITLEITLEIIISQSTVYRKLNITYDL